jgi:hypothetical protein
VVQPNQSAWCWWLVSHPLTSIVACAASSHVLAALDAAGSQKRGSGVVLAAHTAAGCCCKAGAGRQVEEDAAEAGDFVSVGCKYMVPDGAWCLCLVSHLLTSIVVCAVSSTAFGLGQTAGGALRVFWISVLCTHCSLRHTSSANLLLIRGTMLCVFAAHVAFYTPGGSWLCVCAHVCWLCPGWLPMRFSQYVSVGSRLNCVWGNWTGAQVSQPQMKPSWPCCSFAAMLCFA